MSPRTWISASHGLKVSKPGVNVLTATDQQLAFNSSWATPWLYAAGMVPVPAGPTYVNVLYPDASLPAPPLVFAHYVSGGVAVQMGTDVVSRSSGPPPYEQMPFLVVAALDHIEIHNNTTSAVDVILNIYRIV